MMRLRACLIPAVLVLCFIVGCGGGGGADAPSKTNGGANSPEAAAKRFVAALNAENPGALIATLDPVEVRSLANVYADLAKKLRPLGVLRDDGGVKGAEVDMTRLQFRVDDLGSGVAKVRLTHGSLAFAYHPPEGDPGSGGSARFQVDNDGIFAMMHQRSGRWFVSPILTYLEYWREQARAPAPDFSLLTAKAEGRPIKTGEDLIRIGVEAINSRNVGEGIELLTPDEAALLRAYRPSFEAALAKEKGTLEVAASETDIAETPKDDEVRLDVAHLLASATAVNPYETRSGELRLNGLCSTPTDGPPSCDERSRALFGISRYFVMADSIHGDLRVSLVETALGYLRSAAERLSVSNLDELSRLLYGLA